MPVTAQQKWIIKSVCLYPITDFLWILDFILYNWQASTGKDRSNDSPAEIDRCKCRRGEPQQTLTMGLRAPCRPQCASLPHAATRPLNTSTRPATAHGSNRSERDGLQCVPDRRKIDINSAYIIPDRSPSNLISKSFIWLNDSAWNF